MNTIHRIFVIAIVLVTNLFCNTILEAQVIVKNDTQYELSLAFNGFDRLIQAGNEITIPLELFEKLSENIKIKHRFSARGNDAFQLLGALKIKLFNKPGIYRFWQSQLSESVFLDTPDIGYIQVKKSIR